MKTEITCPSGHIVKIADIHSFVDLTKSDLDEAIIFECPGGKRGHTFTLRKAVAKKTFTIEEAARIRAEGGRKKAIVERTITSPVKGGGQ